MRLIMTRPGHTPKPVVWRVDDAVFILRTNRHDVGRVLGVDISNRPIVEIKGGGIWWAANEEEEEMLTLVGRYRWVRFLGIPIYRTVEYFGTRMLQA